MANNTVRFELPLIAVNQAQKDVTHNEALTTLDILSHLLVQSRGLTQPPTTPIVGDAWIVGSGGVNEWQGRDGDIAFWSSGGWRFIPASDGMQAWVVDEQISLRNLQGAWAKALAIPQPMIANPAGGAVVDLEARSAIVSILNTLRSHGLIVTL